MVTVYTADGCSWCRLVKQFLDEKGVRYQEVDITRQPERLAELVSKSMQTSVPVTDVNGAVIIGYNREALERALQAHGFVDRTAR